MRLATLLLAFLACAPVLAAQDEHAPEGHAAEAAPAHAAEAGHEGGSRRGDAGLFMDLFTHLTPHPVAGLWWGGSKGFGLVEPYAADAEGRPLEGTPEHPHVFHSGEAFVEHYRAEFGGGGGILIYNNYTAMWIAGLLVLLVFVPTARRARALDGNAPRGFVYQVLESTVLYVRDEMVYAVMGKEQGRRFVPLFLTMFFFILAMNILGLIPLGPLGATATSWWLVTGGLALGTFLMINIAGIREHGPIQHWKNFAPHGVPLLVGLFIAALEIILMVGKSAALMVRLAANMTAGHLIVLSLFGLVYFFDSLLVGVLPVAMAIAIYALELFVAFVQAYIFTYLSIVFVGAAVHPEH